MGGKAKKQPRFEEREGVTAFYVELGSKSFDGHGGQATLPTLLKTHAWEILPINLCPLCGQYTMKIMRRCE